MLAARHRTREAHRDHQGCAPRRVVSEEPGTRAEPFSPPEQPFALRRVRYLPLAWQTLDWSFHFRPAFLQSDLVNGWVGPAANAGAVKAAARPRATTAQMSRFMTLSLVSLANLAMEINARSVRSVRQLFEGGARVSSKYSSSRRNRRYSWSA